MKALVKAHKSPGIWLEDVEKPDYGINDVLIKIKKTAICGTDIHIYSWDKWSQDTIPVPMTIGHEFYGEIVAMGNEVKGFKIGQRVSGEGHITCGICRNCRAGKRHFCRNTLGVGVNRNGSFAQFLALPAVNALILPDDISDEEAAILDPLGNATHCALAFDVVGEDVLITGAGPIGIMAAAIVKHIGARHVVITDINDYRLELARKLGVAKAINVKHQSLKSTMDDLGMKEGFDVGLEMSGNPSALESMVKSMNHGGRIAMLGIPPNETAMDWNDVIFKSITIKGIYGRQMFETWYKMMSLIQSGLDVKPIITHRFPIQDYEQAFKIMASGQSGKIILNWN